MRLPALCVLVLASFLTESCSKQAPTEAAPAQVIPIAPLLDWASVADRIPGSVADAPAVPAAPRKPGRPAALLRRATPEKPSTHHALFARLPQDALLVIELPELAELPRAFEASGLSRLLCGPQIQGPLAALRSMWSEGLDQLHNESPQLSAAMDLVPELGGRMALSVSGLTADSLAASTTDFPWVLTVIYDAGAQADRVSEAVAPLFSAVASQHKWRLVEKAAPAWGFEMGDSHFTLDLERRGNVFELRGGVRSGVVRELAAARKRTEETSFASTRVAIEASQVESLGATEVAEVHFQLTPLWDGLRANASKSDLRVLARTGITQFYGASMAIGRTKQGLAEALTLHSPAGIDLITHVLTGEAIDIGLARSVPAELPNAGLYSFDGTRVIADLCLLLPREGQSDMVRALAQFRREYGVDLEKDLLANFGHTIALATSDLSLGAADEPSFPDLFAACQVVDANRARWTVNAIAAALGSFGELREELIEGVRVNSLKIPLAGIAPDLEVHWCIRDSALLASTRKELLLEAMRGIHGREISHAGLRGALTKAGAGCFAVGFNAGASGAPDSITLGRRTKAGLELTATDGMAMQSTILALCSFGVASSLALPKLASMRHDAGEKTAANTLTSINEAQVQARAAKLLDQDSDGRGEALFLPELCGASPLRGSSNPIRNPDIENDFEWIEPGIGSRRGFLYRVDLASSDGHGVCSADGISNHPVLVDSAEKGSVAYAWPADSSSGTGVFAFDAEGGLYRSDNQGEAQGYHGDHAPEPGAHWTPDGRPANATRYVGRDGGIWLRVRALDPVPPGR